MHVGDLLAEMLIHQGVGHVFGVPGGQTRPLYDAIHDRPGQIRHVLMRDERSGVFAADGYARITGGLGVCDATVGPGATNLVSGLAEAKNSSSAVVAIIADIPRGWEHLRPYGNASQGFNQRPTLEPVSKAYFRVEAPETAARTFDLAFRTALSGRKGPVIIEVPDDVFQAECPAWSAAQELPITPDRPVAPKSDIDRAVDLLTQARRPVLLVGSGAHDSAAWEEIATLAESLDAPVLATITGKGVVPDQHPLAVGVAGIFGQTGANELLGEADLVFAIGTKLGQLTTYSWNMPRTDQTLVQLDIDPGEIGRVFSPAARLVGDARTTLTVLNELLPPESGDRRDPEWGSVAVNRARRHWLTYNTHMAGEPDMVDPRGVLAAVSNALAPQDVLVCDASLSSGWGAAYFYVQQAGRHFLAPRGMAGLGWGGPAAIGVQAAVGSSARVVCLVGDGAWGYSLTDVESAVRQNLPVVFVVLNNGMLAWVHHSLVQNDKVMSSEFGPSDYAKAGEAFGALGLHVERVIDLDAALRTALDAGRPAVVDVRSSQVLSPVLKPPSWMSGDVPEY
jgi:acetolactate synthase-1/2/3 large subunit